MCVCWVPGACMGYGARCVHGATGALHDGGMRRGGCRAVRRGERGRALDVRYAHGWGMVPARSTGAGLPNWVSHRSPRAPVRGGRGARGSSVEGCPKAVAGRRVAASGLSSSGRTRTFGLSVSVDSVISSYDIPSREQERAQALRVSVTARWANRGRNRRARAAGSSRDLAAPFAVASGAPGAGRPTPRTCAPQPHPTATNRPRTTRAKTAER